MSAPSPYRDRWDLDPTVVFLNHGSFGACPRAVLEAQARHRAAMEAEPVRYLGRELLRERLPAARAALARFVGAETADLVFVPNATTGVNAVLRSLALEPGDELVVTDHGYNACRNAAEFVCQRAGARVVVARVPFPLRSTDEVVEAVLAAVGPRTRLVMVDHITSPTGLVLPVARIAAALAERGVELLVDGAHGPGMLPLDLPSLGVAYYTGNCHKWMCAPKGAGLLWVRRDLQESVRPAVISHGANARPPGATRYEAEFSWTGTDDPSAWLAVADAIAFFEELLPGGWDELMRHNHALALEARGVLCAALGLDPPQPEDAVGTLVSLPLPAGDPDAPAGAFDVDPLQRTLFDEHGIEVPIMSWPAKPQRVLRVSAQLYNDAGQYRLLADALASRLG